jgi:TM2 domain-containing membrane protein YozV
MTQPPPEPPAPDEHPPPDWQQQAPPPGYQQPPPDWQQQAPPPGYQQPGYGQPGYGQAAPYGMVPYDPQAKSKIAAGLLGIFLGGFGVHRFYLGFTKIGIIQIVVTIFTCGIGSLWGFVEGILYLVGSNGYTTDANGRPLRD